MLLRINPWKRAAFIAVAVPGVLAAVELVFSVFFHDLPPADRLCFNLNPLANEELYLYDPVLFWRLKPGAKDDESEINVHGMRGPAMEKVRTPGALRVLLLGDSVPYGFKLEDGKTIADRMRYILGRSRPVEVINGGVVGYSSFQTMRYFQCELASYNPDFVVVYVGNNDWMPSPTFPDKKQPVLAPPAGKVWNALYRRALYRVMRLALLKSGFVEKSRKAKNLSEPRVAPGDYAKNLLAIRGQAVEIGATPLFCRIVQISGDPTCVRDGFYKIPEELTQVDTLKPFEGICMPLARRYFLDGIHPTAQGARLIAEVIASKIEEFSNP